MEIDAAAALDRFFTAVRDALAQPDAGMSSPPQEPRSQPATLAMARGRAHCCVRTPGHPSRRRHARRLATRGSDGRLRSRRLRGARPHGLNAPCVLQVAAAAAATRGLLSSSAPLPVPATGREQGVATLHRRHGGRRGPRAPVRRGCGVPRRVHRAVQRWANQNPGGQNRVSAPGKE